MRKLFVFSVLVLCMSCVIHENHAFSRRFLRKLLRRGMRQNQLSQSRAQMNLLSDEMVSKEESGGSMGNNQGNQRNAGNNRGRMGINWEGMGNSRRNMGNNWEALENMLDQNFDMDLEDFMPFYMNFRKYLRWFRRNRFSTTTPSSATTPYGGTTQGSTTPESSETSTEETEVSTSGTTPDMIKVTTEKVPTPITTEKVTIVPVPVTTEKITYPPTPIPTDIVTNAPIQVTTRGYVSTPPPATVPPTYVPGTVYPPSTQKPVTTTRDRRIDLAGKEPWWPTVEEEERLGGKMIPVDDGIKIIDDGSVTKATTAQIRYTTEAIPSTQTSNLNADDRILLAGEAAAKKDDRVEEKLSLPNPVPKEQNFTFQVGPSIPFITDLTGTKLGIGESDTDRDEYVVIESNGKTSTASTKTNSKPEIEGNAQSKNIEIEKEMEGVTKQPAGSTTKSPKTTVFFTTYKISEIYTPAPAVPASKVPTITTEKPWVVLPGIGRTFMEVVPDPVLGAKDTNWVVIPNSGRLNMKENKSVSLNRV